MTSTAKAPDVDSGSDAHEQEALLLVELLRTSRLSLLFAEPGSDKTALLKGGLMPLLCRRAGDQVGPAIVRTSGVVVPFPDRRSRPSSLSGKRRREVVVYCGDWTETPLAVLRDAIYRAVGASPVERAEPFAPLSVILEDLSQRFDANFVVLLDWFEDLLHDLSHQEAIAPLMAELAEAVNQPQLPANFLIAVAEDARPRLAGLRTRIPGFDDFSLKLAPPRDFKRDVPSVRPQERVGRPVVEALPVLTETLIASPARPAGLGSVIRAPGRAKVKREPPPRVQVTVEDVYAMIEAALASIVIKTANEAFTSSADARDRPASQRLEELAAHAEPRETALATPGLPTACTPTRAKGLEEAIERMERRLRAKQDERG